MRHLRGDARPAERALSIEGLYELFGRNTRLFLGALGFTVFAALCVVAARAPSYRARATLVLDDASKGAGVLGELAMLGKAPQAASQIEILRARSIALETVETAPPGDAELAARRLGLTTLVDDPLLKPLNELLFSDDPPGRLPTRLRASIECDDEHEKLRELEVEFVTPDRVRLRALGVRAALGICEHEPVDVELGPQAIEFGPLRVRLTPEGDLSGRTFRLTRLTREEALRRLMDATRVRETERGSGVIELSVDDSDPRRAAEAANALCLNYLARGEDRGFDRVSRTIAFIDEQLARQNESLRVAEDEVVELRRANPLSLNVGKAGESLIEQMSQLDLQRMQLEVAKISVTQALERLQAGDLEALSRVQVELGDPISAAYFQSLAQLSAEHALQERSDSGTLKMRMQEQALALESTLRSRTLDLETLRGALAAFDAGDRDVLGRLGGGPPSARDPLLEGYLQNLADLQARQAHLAARTTAEHPDRRLVESHVEELCARIRILLATRVAGLEAQVEDHRALLGDYRSRIESFPVGERGRIDTALAQLRERTATHLRARLDGLVASERALARQIDVLEDHLGALPEEARRVADPARRLTAHTEIVKFLLGKQQEAEITRASAVAAAEFIDVAAPTAERSGPSVPLHLAAGLLLGVVCAFGACVLKESLSRGIFTSAELELASGLPAVGAIPDFRRGRYKVKNAGPHFLPLRDDPEGAASEALRSLRATLKYVLGDGETRVVAATSCTQGEGKSSTNVALAQLFARSGRRVLLVDCDMRRPSIDKYLRTPLGHGLSDVLAERAQWRDVLRRGVEQRLDVLCAGPQPSNPGDLLEGERFARLIEEARAEYDLVVCDMPPAFAVSDLESAASRIDALLLVVRCDKVPARAVGEAAQRLKRSGVKLIGAVLNGVGVSLANGRYGYGYGYGYGEQRGEQRDVG